MNKVKVLIEGGSIKMRPAKATLKSVYGSVKPLRKKLSFKKIRDLALYEKLNAIRRYKHF